MSSPARGHTTSYAYDSLNRQTQVVEAVGTSAQRTTTLLYDAADNLVMLAEIMAHFKPEMGSLIRACVSVEGDAKAGAAQLPRRRPWHRLASYTWAGRVQAGIGRCDSACTRIGEPSSPRKCARISDRAQRSYRPLFLIFDVPKNDYIYSPNAIPPDRGTNLPIDDHNSQIILIQPNSNTPI
jgi:hypothetical protein